jgi:hypothetical protein
MIVSDATMWSVTLESSFMIVNYDHNAFTVHDIVATIVNYDHKMFIVQATGLIFLGKARSIPQSGGSESFSFWIGSGLTCKYKAWLGRMPGTKALAYFATLSLMIQNLI